MATDSNPGGGGGLGVREWRITPDLYPEELQRRLKHQRLQKAAMEGDWKEAKEILNIDESLKTARLSMSGMTALHIASKCGKSAFVVKLVARLDASDLMTHDQQERTALHYAASAASVEAATAMVKKQRNLPNEADADGYTPLYYAANWRHPSKAKEMVEYLHGLTDESAYTSDFDRASNLIVAITASGCHGIALKGIDSNPELAVARNESGWSILHVLASQPSSLLKSSAHKWSKSCILSWTINILCRRPRMSDEYNKDSIDLIHAVCEKLQRKDYIEAMMYFLDSTRILDSVLHTATKNGAHELVKICLSYFPELIWYSAGNDDKFLLHIAVEYRQEEIFDHIMDLVGGSIENYSQTKVGGKAQENILHLAAKLAPAHQLQLLPGPAFQMQKELQWFKAVEELVYKDEKVGKNKKGMIPMVFFFEEHKDLIRDAKEWMKATSYSCMVIAALVATVAFASMITVPGGTNDSTGLPVFSDRVQFIIFSVTNALSMISSVISLLVFLSIQTSRYTDQDFMVSLPKNLLVGLFSLFVAVATMMMAFALAIGMAMHTGVTWAFIPITLVACIPALIFTWLQLPLLFQMLTITTTPGISSKKKNLKLWCLNKPIAGSRRLTYRSRSSLTEPASLTYVVLQ